MDEIAKRILLALTAAIQRDHLAGQAVRRSLLACHLAGTDSRCPF
jgi:hypothetical protein